MVFHFTFFTDVAMGLTLNVESTDGHDANVSVLRAALVACKSTGQQGDVIALTSSLRALRS